MSFLDLLKKEKKVDSATMERAINLSRTENISISEALSKEGASEEYLLETKSRYYNIPAVKVDPGTLPFEIFNYIPEDAARHYRMSPIGLEDGILKVGITDPDNVQAIDALQFIASKKNIPFTVSLISDKNLDSLMGRYKGMGSQVHDALSDIDPELVEAQQQMEVIDPNIQNSISKEEEEKIIEEAPIIKIVAVILRHGVEGDASDIHIENTGEKVVVRFRVDGTLHTSLILPLQVFPGVVARIKILAKLRLDEKRKPQDGSFSTKIGEKKIDFRVSTFPTHFGEKVVLRILDSEGGIKSLKDIGLTVENETMIREALKKPYGLILVTGPTGSGKSTTIYSMLNEIDKETVNVVSLEDPVEFNIPQVNQSQVMPEIGYTFATGLRSILRQDPNVIFVGEIRDKETAQLAIQAALTGHLVLSTLHTNNAAGIVPRLVDMGVDPYLIAPTLILAIAQRLVRKTHPSARQEVVMDDIIREEYKAYFKDLPPQFANKVILPEKYIQTVPTVDSPTGTKGRVAVHEMFNVDRDMQRTILKSPSEEEVYNLARSKGMLTMREDGFVKSLNGIIPITEVYTLADDRD
jgi:type IV pilus assembly protein PilB